MFPLVLIIILNSLIAFAHELSQPLKKYLTRQPKRVVEIKNKISDVEKELSTICMLDNYTEWVKKSRELAMLQRQVPSMLSPQSLLNEAIMYGLGYAFQILGSLILFVISIYYRYTPVIVFEDHFNFSPFGKMISFPTGINNAISIPFWIFVTNFTCRCIANFFRV